MPSWNYRIAERVSWFTGLPTQPAGKCQTKACAKEADTWVAYSYVSGRRGRVCTGHRRFCRACAEAYVARKNPSPPTGPIAGATEATPSPEEAKP